MRTILIIIILLFLAACSGTGNEVNPSAAPTVETALPNPTSAEQAVPSPAVTLPAPPDTGEASPTANLEPAATPTVAPTPVPASPAGFPDPGGYIWQSVARSLESPNGLANAGDGSGRLFILEQAGVIRILQNGELSTTPFLDITDRVGSQANEQGLLGLAFHPRYTENGFFYINYTDLNGDTVIARFQVSAGDPNLADPSSEVQLLNLTQPYANHNGGEVTFGPDGYLYLGLGDGGSGGDPLGNGQSLDTRLGKILRIDVNGGDPYAIPADNPFAQGGGEPEIWAYGLRNPWRFSFDPLTRDLYIGDVGQNEWEEIDFLPAGSPGGANFGWNYFEGSRPFRNDLPPANVQFVAPVAEYSHEQGCSVTGGFVYRGQSLPAWQGIYLYADFCSGNVWGLFRNSQSVWEQDLLFENVGRITSFGIDEAGEIYLTDRTGEVYRLEQR